MDRPADPLDPDLQRVEAAEQRGWADRAAGLAELEALAADAALSTDARAVALAVRAIDAAREGSDAGYARAEAHLAALAALAPAGRHARARAAHARGYVAYRRGQVDRVLPALNAAIELLDAEHWLRAEVLDTLGMHFLAVVGHLERARSYFLLSRGVKQALAEGGGPVAARASTGLALTTGNLGRLELAREDFAEAERWFREDLRLVEQAGASDATRAAVKDQLAVALIGQRRLDEAQTELDRALELARDAPTITQGFVLKDLAHLALLRGDVDGSRRRLDEAQALADAHGFREVALHLGLTRGQLHAELARGRDEDDAARALAELAAAREGFTALGMVREACDAGLAAAELLARLGRREQALRLLLDDVIGDAEQWLFDQRQPLDRIEALLESLDARESLRLRLRRMLGGVSLAAQTSRLDARRVERLTVWTCDIRGFTELVAREEALRVVDLLNRFFGLVGRHLLDEGGVIDKYVGDNILAYFTAEDGAAAAVRAARAALAVVELMNTEAQHLALPRLRIGVGLATGQVILGNMGFAGKLEHTMLGTPVNLACRLVGEAEPGEILLDEGTRAALGPGLVCEPRQTRPMKGIPAGIGIYRLARPR